MFLRLLEWHFITDAALLSPKPQVKSPTVLRCSACDQSFESKSARNAHQKQHQLRIACEVCGKEQPKDRLKRHMLVHSQVRNFSCPMCPKTFTLKYNLETHLRVHTGVKPHKCQYCLSAFTQPGNLKSHIQARHPSCSLDLDLLIADARATGLCGQKSTSASALARRTGSHADKACVAVESVLRGVKKSSKSHTRQRGSS
jgi:hypothetical protein